MTLLTKKNCQKCDYVKAWLTRNKVKVSYVDADALLEETHATERNTMLMGALMWHGGDIPVLVDKDHSEAGAVNIIRYLTGR